MRTLVRGFGTLLTVIGIILLLLLVAACATLSLTLPRGDQTVPLPGLRAPVSITFDTDGIPRIKAENERDAVMALGYVHARDRMFQMELMRRAASGRLSEIAGATTLGIDRLMRTLGPRRGAERDLPNLPADTRDLLAAYAEGVNARIRHRGRFIAPEFLLLGTPEPWQPVDSLLWGKTMGLWLSMNWRTELSRLALAGKVPRAMIDELWPPNHAAGRPDASAPALRQFAEAARRVAAVSPSFPAPFTLPDSASNEWAVDGRHTASGAPLLAGDPHLNFGFPGIWYLVRIDLPDRFLAGATGPGVPAIVIGHNSRIAWTFTTTGADVQDVFIETPVGTDQYMTQDGPRHFDVRREIIKVRGGETETLTVRETRHGPVISDLQPAPDGSVLAVAMGNLQPNDTAATGLLALNRATTVAEAGQAASMITAPVQNLLVADRASIGQFVTGHIPIRSKGDGSWPVPGDGTHDWIGWAAGPALPHTINPASGRLINANERIAPPDFPVFMGRDWFGEWRARRIREMLDAGRAFEPADFARMQVDIVSAFARHVLPIMLGPTPPDPRAARLRALLQDWDCAIVMDKPQPLIFNAWVVAFYRAVLGRAGIPPEHAGPVADFVTFVLSPAGAHWCGGDCAGLLTESLSNTARDLTERFGADASAWRWGDVHQALFQHPILRAVPVLSGLTTITIPSPGDDTTVNRGGINARFQNVHGAGFRGVFDLSDLNKSLFMITPGQSGNPLSREARNFVQRWRDGATITLGPDPTAVRATLRMTP